MASYSHYILMKDVEGFKLNKSVKLAIAKITGGDQYSPVHVLRGELVEPHPGDDLNFNIHLIRDPAVLMCLKGDELAPLNKDEFLLLEAIQTLIDRYSAFLDGTLKLATKLQQDTTIFVEVYGQGNVKRQVKGTVMYKGQVQGIPGMVFGIKVSERGVGMSDGTYKGRRYFTCDGGQGMFVPLNRLALRQSAAESHQEKAAAESFKIGDRVHFFDKMGGKRFGTVKWTARSTPLRTYEYYLVGIHTDEVAYLSDFEKSIVGLNHHVGAPKNHCLVLPESLVDIMEGKKEEESITTIIAEQQKKPKEQSRILNEASEAKQRLEDKQLAEAVEGLGEDIEKQLKHLHKKQLKSYERQDSDKFKPEEAHEDQHQINRQNVNSGDYDHDRAGKYSENYNHKQQPNGSQTHQDQSIVAASGASYSFHVNSMVQIPCNNNDVPYRYGIIKWIGNIPKMAGQVAGIELDEYMDGCGDGSWVDRDGKSHQFFKCPYGKGLFYPIRSLQPNSKYSSQQRLYANYDDSHSCHNPYLAEIAELKSVIKASKEESSNLSATIQEIQATNQKQIEDLSMKLEQHKRASKQANGSLRMKEEELKDMQALNKDLSIELEQHQRASKQANNSLRMKEEELKEMQILNEDLSMKLEQHERASKQANDSLRMKEQELKDIQYSNDMLSTKLKRYEDLYDESWLKLSSSSVPSWNLERSVVQKISQQHLGYGAWGAVYSGEFQGEKVAIKYAHRNLLQMKNMTEMVRREISIMAHIRHPNLVRLIGAVFDSDVEARRDVPIILLELMDMNLRTGYEQEQFPRTVMISIFTDIAYALHYLHEQITPIIHRDVSAPNVLLKRLSNQMYKAKVSDLGSANLVSQSRTAGAGAIIYTPPEMFPKDDFLADPPEQTVKVDTFSYGVLLLEVVCRELPEVAKRRSMLQSCESNWEKIYTIVRQCIRQNPEDRPTMRKILNLIEQI